jgi:hypothetical protein
MGKENIYCEIAQSEDGNTWNVLHGKNVVCRCIDKKSAKSCAAELELLARLWFSALSDRQTIREMVEDISDHMAGGATRFRSAGKKGSDATYLHQAKTAVLLAIAAPDLLRALKQLRAIIHDDLTHERQREHGDAIAAADAAIVKAEGGAA